MANSDPNQILDPTIFPTPQALLNWLKPRLPSETVTLWGTKPGTKNVHNLWLELILGESTLSANTNPPLTCRTEKVFVEIIRNLNNNSKLILCQSNQLLSDGTLQSYRGPLSKRMKPSESPEDAAHRAIKEEFGLLLEEEDVARIVWMEPGKCKRVEKELMSPYPGLKSRYVMHTLCSCVEGLPKEPFVTVAPEFGDCSEFKEVVEKALCVKRRNWVWRRLDED